MKRLTFIIHSFGVGCITTSVILQIMVFWNILQNGYFRATEQNPAIIAFEVFMAVYAVIYFMYLLYFRFNEEF